MCTNLLQACVLILWGKISMGFCGFEIYTTFHESTKILPHLYGNMCIESCDYHMTSPCRANRASGLY